MIPTPDQKQWLKDYLRKVMRYRETYEEVYDHMLLSIENHPEQQYFATVVLDIVEKDFGGTEGLAKLEESCRQAVEETAQNQFRDNFKSWFTPPLLVVTVGMFMGLFYLQLPKIETHGALIILFALLFFSPPIVCAVRFALLGYKYGEKKTSVKEDFYAPGFFTR